MSMPVGVLIQHTDKKVPIIQINRFSNQCFLCMRLPIGAMTSLTSLS